MEICFNIRQKKYRKEWWEKSDHVPLADSEKSSLPKLGCGMDVDSLIGLFRVCSKDIKE